MSGKNMVLDVIVRLRDKLSGSAIRKLTGNLKKLSATFRKIGAVGAALGALTFLGPINEAAAFQQKLLDIAGTSELTGNAAFDFVAKTTRKYEELALQVGQYSDIIATGAGEMIAAGLDPKLVDGSLRAIGRSATGANAEFSDMSAVAISLLQTLKLPANELDDALGGLVRAGKEGAFELKDMARFLPTLTSQVAKFGVTGREAVNFLASALQIARKGTSDPGQAANNLKNFLSKVLAPATIKNFSKLGVDIQAVMQDATTKGINPIEAVIQKITKLTGVTGGEIEKLMVKAKKNGMEGAEALGFVRNQLEKIHGAGKLGTLFQDQQVLDFLIPFLANIDEFKRIKSEVAAATGAAIDADFETQMRGVNRQLVRFKEIGTQAMRSIGLSFAQWLPQINENLEATVKWFREFNEETGGGVSKAFVAIGALVAAVGVLGLVLPILTAGFTALVAVFGLLLSPIGLVVGALVAGAALVWKHWGKIGPRLERAWARMKRGMSALKSVADNFGKGYSKGFGKHTEAMNKDLAKSGSNLTKQTGNLQRLGNALAKLAGFNDANSGLAKFAGMTGIDLSKFNSFGEAVGELVGWISELGSSGLSKVTGGMERFTGALADMAEQLAAGANWRDVLPPVAGAVFDVFAKSFQMAVDKIKSLFSEFLQSVSSWPGQILKAIGNIDIASLFNWPSLPSWLGGSPSGQVEIQKGTGGPDPSKPLALGKAANSNVPGKQSSAAKAAGRKVAAAVPAVRQEVAVGGNITVKVDGPGKVTGTQSANKNVPINRGKAVGRV